MGFRSVLRLCYGVILGLVIWALARSICEITEASASTADFSNSPRKAKIPSGCEARREHHAINILVIFPSFAESVRWMGPERPNLFSQILVSRQAISNRHQVLASGQTPHTREARQADGEAQFSKRQPLLGGTMQERTRGKFLQTYFGFR